MKREHEGAAVCLLVAGDYRVGSPRPDGYNNWIEWSKIQYRGGLRQLMCPICGRWKFPQEMRAHGCRVERVDAGEEGKDKP